MLRTAAAAVLALLAVPMALPGHSAERRSALDLSAGVYVPFDGDNRDVFGLGQVMTLGLPGRISPSKWFILDLALVRTAGSETRVDPTFQVRDTRLWLVPISLGWRFNPATDGESRSRRTYIGFGFQTWLSWYDSPTSRTRFAPAFGGFAEWRHEIDLGHTEALFFQQRFFATTKQSFGGSAPETGYSGTTLSLGLNHRLR